MNGEKDKLEKELADRMMDGRVIHKAKASAQKLMEHGGSRRREGYSLWLRVRTYELLLGWQHPGRPDESVEAFLKLDEGHNG